MPLSHPLIALRYMISRFGILCLAMLLLGLPVASYAKDISGTADRGLVSHLDSLSTQGYLSRLAEIKKNSADEFSPDPESPHWAICCSSHNGLIHRSLVTSGLQGENPSAPGSRRYLSPPLRAPPQA